MATEAQIDEGMKVPTEILVDIVDAVFAPTPNCKEDERFRDLGP